MYELPSTGDNLSVCILKSHMTYVFFFLLIICLTRDKFRRGRCLSGLSSFRLLKDILTSPEFPKSFEKKQNTSEAPNPGLRGGG